MNKENIFNRTIKHIKTMLYLKLAASHRADNKDVVCSRDKKETNPLFGWLKRKLKRNKTYTNNPQLTKLMSEKLTFKQLKEKQIELSKEKQNLVSERSAIRYSKMVINKEVDYNEIDKLNDKIYQIDDLLNGIITKIREVGFEYELLIEKALPKSTGGEEIWVYTKTLITEKQYPEKLDIDDLVELLMLSETFENETLKRVRLINK